MQKTGQEAFTENGASIGVSVLDFWRFSYAYPIRPWRYGYYYIMDIGCAAFIAALPVSIYTLFRLPKLTTSLMTI